MVITYATYEESLGWRRLLIVGADYRVNGGMLELCRQELRQCAASYRRPERHAILMRISWVSAAGRSIHDPTRPRADRHDRGDLGAVAHQDRSPHVLAGGHVEPEHRAVARTELLLDDFDRIRRDLGHVDVDVV